VLAIGIVVDELHVVVESVQHYMDEKGMFTQRSNYSCMRDIISAGNSNCVDIGGCIVPVGFIPGIAGRLYQQFAITIASLF